MEIKTRTFCEKILVFTLLVHVSYQQAGNTPKGELWNVFVQGLSQQTGRTVADLNLLGLDDPTIRSLWKSYSTNMNNLLIAQQAQAQQQAAASAPSTPTTTPPPIPDLYQSSYSFSSNTNAQAPATSPGTSPTSPGASGNSDIFNALLNMINQPSTTTGNQAPQPAPSPSPQSSSTSTQDVMQAYQAYFGGNNAMPPTMNVPTSQTPSYDALVQQYNNLVGGPPNVPGMTNPGMTNPVMTNPGMTNPGNDAITALLGQMAGTQPSAAMPGPSQINYQTLIDQYNQLNPTSTSTSVTPGSGAGNTYDQLMSQIMATMSNPTAASTPTASQPSVGSPSSYQSLVDQYNALMGSVPGAAAATQNSVSTTSSNDQMLQLYQQMISQVSSPTGSGTGPTTPSTPIDPTTAATTSDTTSATKTFEQQLQTFFPQFTNLFASNSASPGNQSDTQPNNGAQAIFDALLFGQNNGTTESAGTQAVPPPAVDINFLQSLQKPSAPSGNRGHLLQEHMNNVFKARASRDMGCRFLPELLELDLIPTAPINCMHKCPPPYINSQRFGVFCLCCPPGVNNEVANVMSIFKRASYMETPFTVTT